MSNLIVNNNGIICRYYPGKSTTQWRFYRWGVNFYRGLKNKLHFDNLFFGIIYDHPRLEKIEPAFEKDRFGYQNN